MNTHFITTEHLSLDKLQEIFKNGYKIELSEQAKNNIIKCRTYLDNKIKTHDKPIYGISTGFGSLCNTNIASEDLEQLQTNLVISHACGMGAEIDSEIVKLMMLLKVQALSYGISGVCLETVERLVYFYNNDIRPVVYELGSLGASGDLAPLAHITLALIGLGEVNYKGKRQKTETVLSELNLKPLKLKSKEGLALMNGTQFMLAHAITGVWRAEKIMFNADRIASLSLDGYNGLIAAFYPSLHTIRPHKGQIETAKNIRTFLEGSEI